MVWISLCSLIRPEDNLGFSSYLRSSRRQSGLSFILTIQLLPSAHCYHNLNVVTTPMPFLRRRNGETRCGLLLMRISSNIKHSSGVVSLKLKSFVSTIVFYGRLLKEIRWDRRTEILAVVYVDIYLKANFNEIFMVLHNVYRGQYNANRDFQIRIHLPLITDFCSHLKPCNFLNCHNINITGSSRKNWSPTFVWCDTDHTENDAFSNSSVVAYVFFPVVTFYRAVA
jgi:hypothetical protein